MRRFALHWPVHWMRVRRPSAIPTTARRRSFYCFHPNCGANAFEAISYARRVSPARDPNLAARGDVQWRYVFMSNAEKLCKLFFDAVRVIGLRDYNAHQVEAWAQRTLSPAHAPIRAQGLQGTRATRVPGGQRLDPQLRNGEDALTVEAALTLRAMCGRSGWARKIFTSQRWSRRPCECRRSLRT